MRIPIRHRSQEGNTLLITLTTIGVVSLSLAAFLDMASSQNIGTMRSLQWNSAIPVAEAGIEEALTHLYHSPDNLSKDGWVLASGAYTKERVIGDAKYVTSISSAKPPTITSKGYVRVPFGTNYIDPPRTIVVTTKGSSLFAKGMVALGKITMSGNVKTDSFNSSDPNLSTNGRYDPNKTSDKGDVGTNGTIEKILDTSGQVEIYGHVSTGPGGTVGLSGQVAIGSKAWIDGGNTGIQPGWSTDDMNVSFPDVQAPFSGGAFTPTSGTVNGTNYTYVINSGNWELPKLDLSGKNKVYVGGQAVLWVKGDISMSGQTYIFIETNANFKLYCSGGSASISGQGVANGAGKAENFSYYGLPSNKDVKFSGNSAFIGTIYAPSAKFSLSGGGNNTVDFIGASITGEVSMSGKYEFHYDEQLGGGGGGNGYVITSWNEI